MPGVGGTFASADRHNEGVGDSERQSDSDAGPDFRPGDRVRVLVGPFEDFAAVVREVIVDVRKLRVTVEIFGRDEPVDLDFNQARRLDLETE